MDFKLTNIFNGVCWKCTKMEFGPDYDEKDIVCKRIFELTRGAVTKQTPGRTNIVEVVDVFKCRKCGETVPLDTWYTYQNTGDVIIKSSRRKAR